MKEANYHDDKMEAYCNAVHRLEDRFDGLELNHIARKYNEEADQLAKIASGRTTVPPNVFTRDLAKPFVNLKYPPKASGMTNEPSGANDRRALGQGPLGGGVRGHGHGRRGFLGGRG